MKNLLEYNFPYIINTYDYINIYNKNKLLAYYVKAKNENLDKTNNNGDEEKITKFEIIRKYLADLKNKSNKPLDQITFKL